MTKRRITKKQLLEMMERVPDFSEVIDMLFLYINDPEIEAAVAPYLEYIMDPD